MSRALSSAASIPRTYAELRHSVERVIIAGRQEVERAWVQTYHETGRLIAEHLLLNQDRADYGTQTIARLAADTQVSRRTLYECMQFFRCYPIVRPVAQFGWNRCRLLCQVGDVKQRAALVAELKRGGLPAADLKARVRALNAVMDLAGPDPAGAAKTAVKILKPKRGTRGLYRVIERDAGLAVDIGFKLYLPLTPAETRGLKAGAIVRHEDGVFAVESTATSADLFTYRAMVRRVIDGDTLAVTIVLPLCEMDEKLRLRGLDCPEMDTPEGKVAKRFTETLLVDATEVVIATSKVDKYDRYLADVHIRHSSGEEIFLNNALLKNGQAVPMGAEAMNEWTP